MLRSQRNSLPRPVPRATLTDAEINAEGLQMLQRAARADPVVAGLIRARHEAAIVTMQRSIAQMQATSAAQPTQPAARSRADILRLTPLGRRVLATEKATT